MAIKGILFDNDGTLVDTHDLLLESFQYATRTVLGVDLPEEVLMAGVGTPLARQMEDFTDDSALQQELLDVYRTYNHKRHDEVVHPFPDVKDGLDALHAKGVRMGVVTAKLHELAWRGLELTGLDGYMDCLVGPDDWLAAFGMPVRGRQPLRHSCRARGRLHHRCGVVGHVPPRGVGSTASCVLRELVLRAA